MNIHWGATGINLVQRWNISAQLSEQEGKHSYRCLLVRGGKPSDSVVHGEWPASTWPSWRSSSLALEMESEPLCPLLQMPLSSLAKGQRTEPLASPGVTTALGQPRHQQSSPDLQGWHHLVAWGCLAPPPSPSQARPRRQNQAVPKKTDSEKEAVSLFPLFLLPFFNHGKLSINIKRTISTIFCSFYGPTHGTWNFPG